MGTEEIIKIVNEKRRLEEHEGIRQALFYRLYKEGLNGCDIARLFGYSKPSAYDAIYTHRDRMEINDKKAMDANDEIWKHDVMVQPVIKRLKIEGYEIYIDNVLLVSSYK